MLVTLLVRSTRSSRVHRPSASRTGAKPGIDRLDALSGAGLQIFLAGSRHRDPGGPARHHPPLDQPDSHLHLPSHLAQRRGQGRSPRAQNGPQLRLLDRRAEPDGQDSR